MTPPKEDGGPAFPAEGGADSGLHAAPGMTLRDWFAGQALGGMVASSVSGEKSDKARAAYEFADAMLAARVKS